MQELVKYRGMYTSMAELLKSGTPGPDLHAHHDLLASALPQGSGGQVIQLTHILNLICFQRRYYTICASDKPRTAHS